MSCEADETEARPTVVAVFSRQTSAAIATVVIGAAIVAGSVAPVDAQSPALDAKIEFNIPAQPFSRALMAYSAATGLEIFYNAALAEKQYSAEVVGAMTPSIALQILLRGTGYVGKTTGQGAFTIVPTPHEATASAAAAAAARRRHEPYFAAIQARISDALCRNAGLASAGQERLFQVWLASSGVITRAEVIGDNGEPMKDQTSAATLRGLALVAPPASMPQPISMVIFPPSGTFRTCEPASPQRGAEEQRAPGRHATAASDRSSGVERLAR